jgi:hypothetical protein
MAPGKKDETGETPKLLKRGEPHYDWESLKRLQEAGGPGPEEPSWHQKRDRPYPLGSYSFFDRPKIIVQENRVVSATLVGSVVSQFVGVRFDSPTVCRIGLDMWLTMPALQFPLDSLKTLQQV